MKILMSKSDENIINESDYNSQLIEYEKLLNEYAENGKYEKAELCKEKIDNLKKSIKKKRKKDLEQRQNFENENLETNYQNEIKEFNRIFKENLKN